MDEVNAQRLGPGDQARMRVREARAAYGSVGVRMH